MNKQTIEIPIAWVVRLKEYTKQLDDIPTDNQGRCLISALLGYLESLDILIKKDK